MSGDPMVLHKMRRRLEVRDADLSGSTFTDVNLAGAVFIDINLTGAKIRDVNLTNVSFADCSLDGMTIEGIAVTDLLEAWRKQPG